MLKGTYTWTEAMDSAVYGEAVEALVAGPPPGEAGPARDYLAEATEAAEVEAGSEHS